MKTKGLFVALMALIMCFVCNEAYAYDIEVKNADGVTIYYNYFNEGRELEVTKWVNKYSGSVVIPEEVTYGDRTLKVTSIGYAAFQGCYGLTSVTIPNSVTSIGNYAFAYCSGLTSVTIGNSVTSIGGGAFSDCSGLTSVTIPNSVTSIGLGAFSRCSGLTSVTIPNSVTSIGDAAFSGCSGLTSVTIPSSVTSIGSGAFNSCSGLTSVTIPNSVTSIGGDAFGNCSGLTSITIPNSVTTVENVVFYGCSGLTSVTIPNSVTSIGIKAFYGCSSLTSITIPNSVTSIGESAFSGCNSMTEVYSEMVSPCIMNTSTFPDYFKTAGTLYVPAGTRQYYIERGWGNYFINIVEAETSEPIWLSIINAEQGSSKLKCEAGKSYTFRFEASDGWSIHSVIYQGADVTAWLTEDFEFTTPAMSTSAELIVTYEQGTTAVKAFADESAMRVVLIDGEIVAKNAEAGTPIRVYDLSGRLIEKTTAIGNATRVAVPAGEKMVVVKVGERAVKVRMGNEIMK